MGHSAEFNKFMEEQSISMVEGLKRAEEMRIADKEGRLIVLPCAAGDEVWVIDRDEDDGKSLDYSGYVFITAINNYAIVSPFIMNSGDINDILEYQIDNFSSDLITVPLKDCYFTSEAAEAALKEAQGCVRENVQAEWLINSDGYYPYCSHCKREPQGRVMTDFCPNCGADMKVREN